MREELKWFLSSSNLDKFRGKHVAIVGNRVFVGDSALEALRKAEKERPRGRPVLTYVPRRDALIL